MVVLASLTFPSAALCNERDAVVDAVAAARGTASLAALLACCLLVAIASATVLTTTAGARRGVSAVTRLLAVTRPATAEVVPNRPGFDWNRIRALPEVEALTTFPAYSGLSTDAATDNTPHPFVPADTGAMRAIETPVVLTGRLADPAASAAELRLATALGLTRAQGTAVAAATGWLALGRPGNGPAVRRSTVAWAAAQAGLPVPTVVGVRFALEPGRGANAVPARAALLARSAACSA